MNDDQLAPPSHGDRRSGPSHEHSDRGIQLIKTDWMMQH